MAELRNKLGLVAALPADQVNHALNIFLLVQDVQRVHRDTEDKSASSPSSSADDEVHVMPKKRLLPQRRPYARGSTVDLDKVEDDADIVDELVGAKFSTQGLYTLNIRVRWWALRARARGLAPWPLTPPLIALAAALLRRGGYRSAPLYRHAATREHIRLDFP